MVMKEWGFAILRFTNDDVINDLKNVINRIERHITNNTATLLSKRKTRLGWEEQLRSAINAGYQPNDELLEGFADNDIEL